VTVFNGYPLSVVLAVLLHGSVIAALLYFQQADTEVIDIVRPPSVKALLVNENPQARNEQVQQRQAQQEREQRAERERQERQRQEAATAERQREQAEQRAEEQRVAQQQQQDQERRQTEQRQAEQQRVAEEQKQREQQQREAEQRRQQELAAEQERQRVEQAQAQALAQQQADSRELAETEAELVMAYSAVIHDLVQQYWSRPPSARNGMVVVLRIRMVPTGDILDVEIVQSSGDFAFDRAAESAVLKVNRFTELQGMDPRLFDRNFRTFLLTFRPQDLLN
jgi:colicin import membrane protein